MELNETFPNRLPAATGGSRRQSAISRVNERTCETPPACSQQTHRPSLKPRACNRRSEGGHGNRRRYRDTREGGRMNLRTAQEKGRWLPPPSTKYNRGTRSSQPLGGAGSMISGQARHTGGFRNHSAPAAQPGRRSPPPPPPCPADRHECASRRGEPAQSRCTHNGRVLHAALSAT